jgi:hypothetical protein
MYSFQFTTAGVYVYNDKNNAALTGVVTVQSGAAGGNVAFGRPIRASSFQPGHPPEMAVDGDQTSYWASYAGSPWSGQNRQWIYVDLGSTQDVSSMHMRWGNKRFPRSYALYTWADYCRGWCLLGSTNRGDGDDTWTTNGKVSGQYFLMDLVQPYFNGGEYQLLEWEIFGPGGGTVPPVGATNLALNKAATASSQDIGFEAAKGTDGNLATEYHSAVGLPAWYYVDLGAVQDFDRVDIHWSANMHATSYTLYTWNGRGWGPVYSTRSGAGGDESLRIAPQRSRYALLYAAAGPANMIGIRELEVYYRTSSSGGGVTPPAPPMPSPPAPPIPFGSAASGIWSLRPIAGKPDVVPAGLLTVIDAQVQPSRGLGTSGKPAGDLLGVSPNALPNPANPAGQARD